MFLPLRSSTTAGGGCATFLFQEFLVHATIPSGMVGAVTSLYKGMEFRKQVKELAAILWNPENLLTFFRHL